MPGEATLREIAEQFDLWKTLFEDLELLQKDVSINFAVREYDDVLFIGAGTSYHLAAAAAAAYRFVAGETALAVPASEVVFFNRYNLIKERKYLAVLFSRSGRTKETLTALEEMRKHNRIAAVAISCDPSSPLCAQCEVSFPVKNCFEESVIMTKSFTSMLFVSHMVTMALSERFANATYLEQLADEGKAAFEMQRRVIDGITAETPLDRITILGGGPMYGLAREAGLKLDEAAHLRTQVLNALELRHGPRSALTEKDLVILFGSTSALDLEIDLLREVKSIGAKTLVFCEKKEREYDGIADYIIPAGRGIPEVYRGMLYMPFIQYLAVRAALQKGIDPDSPPNLTHVVTF
ncbi:MAG TPA: SIS domain-containing protein [bacterium]|nr:SIS domain-containing protein [bacterium]